MKFEPQKFFIGLIDFFSILLPGALLTYMLKGDVGSYFMAKDEYLNLGTGEAWAVFLFTSYLLGHFIFLLGSSLLDDYVYEKVRSATYINQVKQLADGKVLRPKMARWLASRFFSQYVDLSLYRALSIKKYYLHSLMALSSINAFQWCKARLNMEQPEALVAVQRFEADSKFFRSLFVVLCILIPWNFRMGRWEIALVGLPMMMLALWRYIDQRAKATRQAYWYIITLEANRKDGFRQYAVSRSDGMTHAGGVVFRKKKMKGKQYLEYLLVQAKNKPEEWVLPKGHIEPGERITETAVREVREEAGVWATIKQKDPMINIEFEVMGEHIKTQFFLMQFLEESKSKSDQRQLGGEDRKKKWMTLDEAIKKATYIETKEVLKQITSRN